MTDMGKISRQVNLTDFKAEYKVIGKEVNSALKRVFERGYYILGPEVSNLEKKLASFVDVKYAVGVACGTDALTLAIKSLDLKHTDAVLLPANVYPTAFGVSLSGLKVKLCDVDPQTSNINLETVKKAYAKDIKVIVVVHLYGNPVDIEPIKKFAKKNKIYLIEDCAQAVGSIYKEKLVGSFGDIACFSFYPNKNLGAYGDGGAILTNNLKIYKKLKLLRMYGEKERYQSVLLGHNSRLDELQAAILLTKLKYLKTWNQKRRKIARKYVELLKDLSIGIVKENPWGKSNYHLFVIKVSQRSKLMAFLKEKGIQTAIHYPTPIHLIKTFSHLGFKKGSFPISEKESEKVLSLPMYPFLKESDVYYTCKAIKDFFKEKRLLDIQ